MARLRASSIGLLTALSACHTAVPHGSTPVTEKCPETPPQEEEPPALQLLSPFPERPSPWPAPVARVDRCSHPPRIALFEYSLRVLGDIDLRVRAVTWHTIPFPYRADQRLDPTGPGLTLSGHDANGHELFARRIVCEIIEDGYNDPMQCSFMLDVPVPSSLRELIVRDAERQIGSLRGSTSPPVIWLERPLPNETLPDSGSLVIQWSEYDPDGDEVDSWIEFSADDGETYHSLDDARSPFKYDLESLPGTGCGRLRVHVRDDWHISTVEVRGLRVPNKPPHVHLTAEGLCSREYTDGNAIVLDAKVSDVEDRLVDDLTWTSHRDGVIGTGRRIIPALQLSPGQHMITVSARDKDGLVDSDSCSITIRRGIDR